jgi:hypothetical protein
MTKRKVLQQQPTSAEAWLKWLGIPSDSLDAKIIAVLADAGSFGLMCWQIEVKIARSHQSVSGNLRHLVERGLVKASGQHGRTPSRRKAMCWVLNPRPPKRKVRDSRGSQPRGPRPKPPAPEQKDLFS